MADEVREYIRAAQAAEMRGDTADAVGLLLKAASLYRSGGATARALQMLRHARKLDGTRQDIIEEISRLEWLPERPIQRAADGTLEPSDELKSELEKLLHPIEDPPPTPGSDKAMFDRGPTRADPTLNAWCSFCCKPKKEIGELVAGPAGAFICAGCLQESSRLLAISLSPSSASDDVTEPHARALASNAPPAAVDVIVPSKRSPAAIHEPKRMRHAKPQASFFGQPNAARAVEMALQRGARLILVVGPEGTGKSAFLADLERRGMGTRVSSHDSADVMLIDAFEQITSTERELFAERFEEDPKLRAVIALRADGALQPLSLQSDDGPFVLHPTANILSTLGQVIPPSLADHVDLIAAFEPLTDADLRELAYKLLERRAAELDLSEDVVGQLVNVAARSGRGGRELEALIRRIPPGSWTAAPVAAAAAPKPKRTRKKP